MDEAGDDVAERETRLAEERLDVPQGLLGLRLDSFGELLRRRVGAALAGEETQSPRSSPGEYGAPAGPMSVFVMPLLPLALYGI